MNEKVLTRSEVEKQYTWDLSAIYADEAAFDAELKEVERLAKDMMDTFKGKIVDASFINKALDAFRAFQGKAERLGNYTFLSAATDLTNAKNQQRKEMFFGKLSRMMSGLSFIESDILKCSESVIEAAMHASTENAHYLQELLRFKPHVLSPDAERVVKALTPVLDAPFAIYTKAKFADLDYDAFTVNDKSYPMSFVMYENVLETTRDTQVRRKAFEVFSKQLRQYNHTMAGTYAAQLQKEKILATVRGFDSVFDYLLFDQKVDRTLYDRQIDTIMDRLAAPMRKYAKLRARMNGLDTLTFADLKIAVDYDYEPEITVDGSRKYIKEALSVYGPEYAEMLDRAFDERWIDFVQNKGKSSGAFCSTPYAVHPYVLISWSARMTEVFVLAHELGHAGHFYLSQQHQNVFNWRPSLYFIEAPSTMNELLMANYLMEQKTDDLRFKRWVLASMISRTYYHNFVTHLLEAHFQREVYKVIDAGGSVQAEDLNRLKRATLEQFWGDTVDITEGAELTWMRQLHYYKGLYPYTYSAGLTVATAVNKRILEEGPQAIEDWKKVLKTGGMEDPVGLAQIAGVDITTDKPLNDTIDYISGMVDEIVRLTEQIDGITLDQ